MSRDALIAAGESMSAFDPTPMPDSLAVCLKPYEQLVPGCNLETEIRQTVAGYGRVGLVGGIGCGKRGVSRYALGGPGLGMIALNVVTEDREKIATVRGFLEILVAQLLSRSRPGGHATLGGGVRGRHGRATRARVAALRSRRTRLDEGGVVRQASVRLPRQQQLPGDRDGAEGERDRLLRRAASRRSCSPPSDLPEPRIATSRGRDGSSNRL